MATFTLNVRPRQGDEIEVPVRPVKRPGDQLLLVRRPLVDPQTNNQVGSFNARLTFMEVLAGDVLFSGNRPPSSRRRDLYARFVPGERHNFCFCHRWWHRHVCPCTGNANRASSWLHRAVHLRLVVDRESPAFLRRAKISSLDPPLFSVWTAYPAHPFPALLDPPVESARRGPSGDLHFNRWIHFPAIRFGELTRVEVLHVLFKHECDFAKRGPRSVGVSFPQSAIRRECLLRSAKSWRRRSRRRRKRLSSACTLWLNCYRKAKRSTSVPTGYLSAQRSTAAELSAVAPMTASVTP
jgi:hypothetical protein